MPQSRFEQSMTSTISQFKLEDSRGRQSPFRQREIPQSAAPVGSTMHIEALWDNFQMKFPVPQNSLILKNSVSITA
jgi:hypothetical protein